MATSKPSNQQRVLHGLLAKKRNGELQRIFQEAAGAPKTASPDPQASPTAAAVQWRFCRALLRAKRQGDLVRLAEKWQAELNQKLFRLCHGGANAPNNYQHRLPEIPDYDNFNKIDAFVVKRRDRLNRVLPSIDVIELEALLAQGADGGYVLRTEGGWGAHEQTSALHGLLRRCLWSPVGMDEWQHLRMNTLETIEECENKWGGKEKQLVRKEIDGRVLFNLEETESHVQSVLSNNLAAIVLLLKYGARPTAKESSSDWRGCGSGSTAFSRVLELCMHRHDKKDQVISEMIAATRKRYLEQLLEIFLRDPDVPELLCKGQTRNIASMRSDGYCKSGTLHDLCASGKTEILRLILARLEQHAQMEQQQKSGHKSKAAIVDMLKVDHVMNERGYHTDNHVTSLHLCLRRSPPCFLSPSIDSTEENVSQNKLFRQCLQVASLLLDAGADPNKISSTVMQVEKDDYNSSTDDPRDSDYESPVECCRLLESPLSLASATRLSGWATVSKLPLNFSGFALVYLLVLKGADKNLGSFRASNMIKNCWFNSLDTADTATEHLARQCCRGQAVSAKFTGIWKPLPVFGAEGAQSEHEHRYMCALNGKWLPEFFQYHPKEIQQFIVVLLMALRRHGIDGALSLNILSNCLSMQPVTGLFA